MKDQMLTGAAAKILQSCREKGFKIATAESCTGGLISACLTEIPGSSDVMERGFVTYSNEAKNELLDVPMSLIEEQGAVSEEVVRAMVAGALVNSHADIAVAVTGIAGPGGGSPDKPVGLVYVAAQRKGVDVSLLKCSFGDIGRAHVRQQTVLKAFELLRSLV